MLRINTENKYLHINQYFQLISQPLLQDILDKYLKCILTDHLLSAIRVLLVSKVLSALLVPLVFL